MPGARRGLAAFTAPLLAAGLSLAGGAGYARPRAMNGVLPAPVTATLAARVPFTARVSVTNAGRQMSANGYAVSISDSGRFVMFLSDGSNDAYVRDRSTHTTRVVRGVSGQPAYTTDADMSRDGHHAVFSTYAGRTGLAVFEQNLVTHNTVPVSVDVHGRIVSAVDPSVSADGRYVAFESDAATIVPGDTNGQWDVFVRDMLLHRTVRVSVSSTGRQAHRQAGWIPSPVVRGGRLVFFWTSAAVLTGRKAGRIGLVGHNLRTGATWWVHLATGKAELRGYPGSMSVSTSGKFLAFDRRLCRTGSCTLEIYVRNRSTGATRLASVDNRGRPIPNVEYPSLSADGRYVAFSNVYMNNGRGPTMLVWLRDRHGHHTWQISVGLDNQPPDNDSWAPAVSADGRIVAFSSDANNLVRHDRGGFTDAFIRRLP